MLAHVIATARFILRTGTGSIGRGRVLCGFRALSESRACAMVWCTRVLYLIRSMLVHCCSCCRCRAARRRLALRQCPTARVARNVRAREV